MEETMQYRKQIMENNSRRNGEEMPRSTAVAVRKVWFDNEDDEEQSTGPRLTDTELQALSRKCLWGLLLFLLAGAAAFMVQDFNLYRTFPDPVLQFLGCPPPATLIHLALTGYSFTVVVPVLIRMATGAAPTLGWHHLACRSVFYLFYLVSTTLPQNFLAVIIIGSLLYIVEQVGIWTYLHRNLHGSEAAG
jgi:hypothetical protein